MLNHKLMRKVKGEAFTKHKIQPTFHLSKDLKFHPKFPCQICFPISHQNAQAANREDTGVRDLLQDNHASVARHQKSWDLLIQKLESIQVHWDQFENLIEEKKSSKIFLMCYQNPMDALIIGYTLIQSGCQGVEWLNHPLHCDESPSQENHCFKVLFVNLAGAENQLTTLIEKLASGNQTNDHSFIPVSLSYEFIPKTFGTIKNLSSKKNLVSLKPIARINFGYSHSLKDIVVGTKYMHSVGGFIQHITHEIWKNTPVMSVHILAMILLSHPEETDINLKCQVLMSDFRQKFSSHFDLAFIGEIKHITNQALDIFLKTEMSFTSMAVDVMKFESFLMKSLFLTITNTSVIDSHVTTIKISRNQLMENFREISRLLRYETEAIYPPCAKISDIENWTLHSLLTSCILSEKSDEQDSHEHQMAKKIANALDIDFEDDDDDFLPLPDADEYLYVDVSCALSRQWVSQITSKILDVYYFTAQQVLRLNKLDVIDTNTFVESTLYDYNQQHSQDSACLSEMTVRNCLKLLINERILECFVHSGTQVLYQKKSSNSTDFLVLIQQMAKFI